MSSNELVLVLTVVIFYAVVFFVIPGICVFYKVKKQIKDNKYKKRRSSFKLIKNENHE